MRSLLHSGMSTLSGWAQSFNNDQSGIVAVHLATPGGHVVLD